VQLLFGFSADLFEHPRHVHAHRYVARAAIHLDELQQPLGRRVGAVQRDFVARTTQLARGAIQQPRARYRIRRH
jgi:hypothetical protein